MLDRERRSVSVHLSCGHGGGGSWRSVILHPPAQRGGWGGGGGVRGGSRSAQPYDPLPPPDPSRPQSDRAGEASLVSAAVFQRAQKRRSGGERRDGPISCKSPRHRRKIDFRAPLNGSEHIVLLCLCKAALNYTVCVHVRRLRVLACVRVHVSSS